MSKGLSEELSLGEIESIFDGMGPLYFLNLSGGEPFLRDDIVDIIRLALRYLSPNLIHIPSNGLLPDLIKRRVEEILRVLNGTGTFLTVKLSLDGVGELHDEIRGVKGSFVRFMDTFSMLRGLKKAYPNFHLGINTIVSKFNLDRLDEVVEYAKELRPDSYVTEIAENRSELFNLDDDIAPDAKAYEKVILRFKDEAKQYLKYRRSISKFTDAARLVYYDYVVRILNEQRQVLPCYAGWSNAHLNPYGDVWPCCILGYNKPMGNLREFGYDFKRLWTSAQANAVRRYIRDGKCYCPMANQFYSNMLCSAIASIKVARNLVFA
jgi:MoaA/NifB/PqqE/SkfB family radical SAM enzyme